MLSKPTCCAENICEWVAKTVTLGFVIVNKATSSELSWISMNTGAIPDTFALDDLLMLLGENWCWLLLGPKGLSSTLYSQGCASIGPYGPGLAPTFCSRLRLVNGQCLAKMTICPEKCSVCRSFWVDTFKYKWPAKKIYFIFYMIRLLRFLSKGQVWLSFFT